MARKTTSAKAIERKAERSRRIKRSAVPRGRGRPSSYRAEYADQVRKLCLLNARVTDVEIADFFGVDERTINRWKRRHADFCQSIRAGKILADAEVANSLHKRANGFSVKATKVFLDKDTKQPIYAPYVEHHPDTQAARFWLMNRQRHLWAERQEITGAGSEPLLQRLAQMTDAERLAEAMQLIAEARQVIAQAEAEGMTIDVEDEC